MINNLIKQFESGRLGSALIMTVVLTIMLAVMAVMFVAVARMDSAATSNIADNKMLGSAAKSIVDSINNKLVGDTPGLGGKYYDYPDACDTWLANLEPYKSGTAYFWRQISDVTGFLNGHGYPTNNVETDPCGSTVIKDYPEIKLNTNGSIKASSSWADADGDGIADSKWFELSDLRTSKGKKIYAAVRVIDSSGMININTAYRFDANITSAADANKIDGSSQMQVNLAGLLKGTDAIDKLRNARCGSEDANNRDKFSRQSIWRYDVADGNYRPFDVSDELELRYRYCIDGRTVSRFEATDPCTNKGRGRENFGNLYDASTDWGLDDWQIRITDPNFSFDKNTNEDRRHLLTALNMDRIIAPDGTKMTNINTADVNTLYSSLRKGLLDTGVSNPNSVAAQMAVNIIDYRDADSNVSFFHNLDDGKDYYGFEQPCIYISELAYNQVKVGPVTHKSYAIELYRPYPDVVNPAEWKLYSDLSGDCLIKSAWPVTQHFYVIWWKDDQAPLAVDFNDSVVQIETPGSDIFNAYTGISLIRSTNITVDSWQLASSNWPPIPAYTIYSIQRDIRPGKCIRRLWGKVANNETLGQNNDIADMPTDDSAYIQAHPENKPFTNIGEIGMILRRDAYARTTPPDIDSSTSPANALVNLADPGYQQIFKYLTVLPPSYANQNETRVKGRININTAPAYVLAQLPWVSLRRNPDNSLYNDPNLAKAIVAYRDKTKESGATPHYDYTGRAGDPGFRSIGELCNVTNGTDPNFGIDYYSRDGVDQAGFPDLSGGDGAKDDFEERDLIFARISDLVTVRSDVFTAYILVRVCTNIGKNKAGESIVEGPQKRYMVILDRSQVGDSRFPGNKVIIRAFQVTPEAR